MSIEKFSSQGEQKLQLLNSKTQPQEKRDLSLEKKFDQAKKEFQFEQEKEHKDADNMMDKFLSDSDNTPKSSSESRESIKEITKMIE